MRTFYDWWVFFEQEQPSHTLTLKNSLRINPTSLIGTTVPFSGILGDKRYNMVGLTVVGFDDDANPKRVRLSILGDSPNMDKEVRFKDDKEKSEIEPDVGEIDISLEEFDQILGKGWEPALQQGGAGGNPLGPMGGM
jgi:hypothetical protein